MRVETTPAVAAFDNAYTLRTGPWITDEPTGDCGPGAGRLDPGAASWTAAAALPSTRSTWPGWATT